MHATNPAGTRMMGRSRGTRFAIVLMGVLLWLGPSANAAAAEEHVARIFTNHMVLQREQPLPVWGWSTPGQTITVSFAGQRASAKTDAQGRWRAQLTPLKL